ncbi:MAG: hypothetical protein R3E89_06575 [Thiolinea sp.]
MNRSLSLPAESQSSGRSLPPVDSAWDEPNGFAGGGGDLSTTRLLTAYRSGIFPGSVPVNRFYWWSPDSRAVLFPGRIRITRSLRKSIRNKGLQVSFDRDFPAVVLGLRRPAQLCGRHLDHRRHVSGLRRLHRAGYGPLGRSPYCRG